MTQAAAFQATYSDWKLIKTRGTVQIVFEVPVEQAGLAYEVLGGMPQHASEIWCAIARLQPAKEVIEKPRPDAASVPTAGGAHRSFHEMAPSQQAGLLCSEQTFSKFLSEAHPATWAKSGENAAECVRILCGVPSRSAITPENQKWRDMVLEYRAWMRSPEFV